MRSALPERLASGDASRLRRAPDRSCVAPAWSRTSAAQGSRSGSLGASGVGRSPAACSDDISSPSKLSGLLRRRRRHETAGHSGDRRRRRPRDAADRTCRVHPQGDAPRVTGPPAGARLEDAGPPDRRGLSLRLREQEPCPSCGSGQLQQVGEPAVKRATRCRGELRRDGARPCASRDRPGVASRRSADLRAVLTTKGRPGTDLVHGDGIVEQSAAPSHRVRSDADRPSSVLLPCATIAREALPEGAGARVKVETILSSLSR